MTVTKEIVQNLLATNDRAVARALIVLLDYQTQDEKERQSTSHANGRGFNHVDAPLMTSMAEQIKRGRTLSQKQLDWLRGVGKARSRIGKYAQQLADHANEHPKEKAASAA